MVALNLRCGKACSSHGINMEFSTKRVNKSLSSVRHNPYASEGKQYFSRFNKFRNGNSIHTTPPRKLSYYSFGNKRNEEHKKNSSFRGQALSRSNHILKTSQALNNSRNSASPKRSPKFRPRLNHTDESPKSSTGKRTFKSLSIANDAANDPYQIFTDDDDDDVFLSSKHGKKVAEDLDKENKVNKENNINASQATNFYRSTPKIYSTHEPSSTKRKPLSTLKSSSLLHDISPEKVQSSANPEKNLKSEPNKTFKFKSFTGKENVSETEPVTSSRIEFPHLIGFPNFGNTCYLNAVLQTLISLNPFIGDLNTSMEMLNVPFTSITLSLWNIIYARLKLDTIAVRKFLKAMKENLEKIDGSFSGFKMQDANEFLTQVLDTVKDEIDRKKNFIKFEASKQCNKNDNTPSPLQSPTDNDCTLVKPDSTENKVSESTSNNASSTSKSSSKELLFGTPSSSSPLSLEIRVKDSTEHCIDDEDLIFLTSKNFSTPDQKTKVSPDSTALDLSIVNNDVNPVNSNVNPVVNNFEFELFESYRCLGCGETEGRKQKHFALYLNLPPEGNESIQKSVETYMSEDERDLTCKKCKHKKAAFITSFVQLPRVLIVQMKRYKYKPELSECFKVSSKVDVNKILRLDNVTYSDPVPPPKYVHQPLRGVNSNKLSMQNQTSENSLVTPQKENQPVFSPIAKSHNNEPVTPKMENNVEDDTTTLDDFNGEAEAKRKSEREKEEEEFQWAIKMSLQDSGMCYASNEISNEKTEENEAEPESTYNEELEAESETETETGQHCYRLLSVVSHFGLTTCTGHYVSDILNVPEKQWYHYDDETVTSVSESVVMSEGRQKNGYIFFYVHQDVFDELKNKEN